MCGMTPVERMELWEDRVGALYDGLAYKEASINRMQPFFFMTKRILLAVGCFYWKVELVACMIVIEMIHLCYLVHAMPHDEKFDSKLEILGELTLLFLCYVL